MNEPVDFNVAIGEPALDRRRYSLVQDLFELDVRSLAIFRVALALLMLGDLANRIPVLEMFYSDEGILPRDMAQAYLGTGFWSLYWIDGSAVVAHVLFALTAVSAFCFMIGFKTRLSNIVCLILISSLQVCNPLVLTGGHIEMRLMLFWSVFLPMGAVWSIDARLDPKNKLWDPRVTSMATMAIMIQVASLYFFPGIAKLNGYWFDGHAVEYVLGLEMFVKPCGESVRQFPGFLVAINYLTLVAEVVGPILMFIPRFNKFNRWMMMALFWLMHIGIWMTMSIGIFSLMAMASWLIFVPFQFWEFWNPRRTLTQPVVSWARTLPQLLGNIVCGLALVYVLAINIANINKEKSTWFSDNLRTLGNATMIIQEFKLFGTPPLESPVIEYQAQLNDGTKVDIFRETMCKPNEMPDSVYQYFPTQHWRRVHSNLFTVPDQATSEIVRRIRHRLLDRIVIRWNQEHDQQRGVSSASILCCRRPIELNGNWGEPINEVWAEWPQNSHAD